MTEVNRERRKVQITGAANVCQPVMNCREFSTWRRLLRVTAYVIRFCRKLHLKLSQQSDTNQLQVGLPSTKEIQDAEEYGIHTEQVIQASLQQLLRPEGSIGSLRETMSPRLLSTDVPSAEEWKQRWKRS